MITAILGVAILGGLFLLYLMIMSAADRCTHADIER